MAARKNTEEERSNEIVVEMMIDDALSNQQQPATHHDGRTRRGRTRRRSFKIMSEAKRRKKSFYFFHVVLKYIHQPLLALVILKHQQSPHDSLFGKNIVPLCCFLIGIGLYGAVEYLATRDLKYVRVLSRFALSLVVLTTISLVSMLFSEHVSTVPFLTSTLLPLMISFVWPVIRLAYYWLLEEMKKGFNYKILEKLLLCFKGGDDSSKEHASSVPV